MVTKRQSKKLNINWWLIGGIIVGLAALAILMFYKLGSLMPGITSSESQLYAFKLGWHGLYHNPLNLPLNILWSVVFKFFHPVSQYMLRVPAAIVGSITVIAFFALLKIWFNLRTAVMGTILFATSAWTLHVSRLASYSVEYLAAITFFLLSSAIVQKKYESKYVYWLTNLCWSLLLYVPGMVFFLAYNIYRQRAEIGFGMSTQKGFWSKLGYVFCGLIWLPLIIRYILRSPRNVLSWLGLPNHFASPLHIIKEFGAVFYHIFIRGPLLPSLWLGRLPILDIFGIIAALCGVYFYIVHIKATRTHLVFVSILIGAILIALGGSVSISIVMPLIYVLIATGLAYLLSQWLTVFPENPIARSFGYLLISIAIAASVIYNLRDYFIAWPHNSTSESTFDVREKD